MRATLKLLGISFIPAVSGVLTLKVCLIIAGEDIALQTFIGAFLVIYTAYAQDRIRGGEEDSLNRGELEYANRGISIVFVLIAYIAAIILLYPDYLGPALVPLAVSYVYSRGIGIGGWKINIKGRFMAKNIVVAMVWAYFIASFLTSFMMKIVISYFIFMKGIINTVIYDFRDFMGDSLSGVKTLPVCLGVRKAKIILLFLHFQLHAGLLILYLYGYWRPFSIIFMSFAMGLFYILYFSTSKQRNNILRDIVVDWEWALILVGIILLGSPLTFS
jgi:4-hydroxybenzoate polyprenyltransferase